MFLLTYDQSEGINPGQDKIITDHSSTMKLRQTLIWEIRDRKREVFGKDLYRSYREFSFQTHLQGKICASGSNI